MEIYKESLREEGDLGWIIFWRLMKILWKDNMDQAPLSFVIFLPYPSLENQGARFNGCYGSSVIRFSVFKGTIWFMRTIQVGKQFRRFKLLAMLGEVPALPICSWANDYGYSAGYVALYWQTSGQMIYKRLWALGWGCNRLARYISYVCSSTSRV